MKEKIKIVPLNAEERIKEFSELIKKYPRVKEFYIERAKLYEAKGQYKKAVEDFKKSLPDFYCFNNIKDLCEEKSLIKEAENFYTKAIKENKNDVYKYIDRLHFYMRNREIEKAILECKTILKLSPKDETILILYEILTAGFERMKRDKGSEPLILY